MTTSTIDPTKFMDPKSYMDPKAFAETFEKASSAWYEAWAKSPAFLGAMGKTLEAQLGVKTNVDKFVQASLEAWQIPSRKDMEAMASRIAALEERLAIVEDAKPAKTGAAK